MGMAAILVMCPRLFINTLVTPSYTGVIQELMTMDPYLEKYNQGRLYLLFSMWTHALCIHAENFVLLSWLDLTLCSFEYDL